MFRTGFYTAIFVGGMASSAIASPDIADVEICMNASLSNSARVEEFSARGWTSHDADFGPNVFLQAIDFLSATSRDSQGGEKLLKWATERASQYPAQGVVVEKNALSVLVSLSPENRQTCIVISPLPKIGELARALEFAQPSMNGGKRSFRRKQEAVEISAYEYPKHLRPGLELMRGTIFGAHVRNLNPAP